jgi:hypothetical protein
MGWFGPIEIDVEANLIGLEVEPYHSAVWQEVAGFSHGEDGHPAEALQDCSLALSLVAAEEEDVATSVFLGLAYLADMEYSGSDILALDRALKLSSARLVIEDAEN